ncbi:MAG: hypothetical protein WCL21_15245 [Mariniphaga sp.]
MTKRQHYKFGDSQEIGDTVPSPFLAYLYGVAGHCPIFNDIKAAKTFYYIGHPAISKSICPFSTISH